MRTTALVALVAAAAVSLLLVAPAAAQDLGFRRFGIRGGATIDPDQVHVGVHVHAGHFDDRIRFQPSFEIGFGDHLIVGTVNIDALYEFDPRPWRPYLGGGLGVALIDFDDDFFPARRDDLEVDAGLNLFGGIEWGSEQQYMLELRAGIGDIPDLKVTAGISF